VKYFRLDSTITFREKDMNANQTNRFPIIFGHRGASKYAPENTMTAFQLALDQGADGF